LEHLRKTKKLSDFLGPPPFPEEFRSTELFVFALFVWRISPLQEWKMAVFFSKVEQAFLEDNVCTNSSQKLPEEYMARPGCPLKEMLCVQFPSKKYFCIRKMLH
jgi:hypothetical protein